MCLFYTVFFSYNTSSSLRSKIALKLTKLYQPFLYKLNYMTEVGIDL